MVLRLVCGASTVSSSGPRLRPEGFQQPDPQTAQGHSPSILCSCEIQSSILFTRLEIFRGNLNTSKQHLTLEIDSFQLCTNKAVPGWLFRNHFLNSSGFQNQRSIGVAECKILSIEWPTCLSIQASASAATDACGW